MINRDGRVRVLPIHVANKIAAGEVVERPASVAKELIENAIDAGAKNIKVAISSGGRKLVSVQDDGSGMTRDDALLSLERQATSKILDVDDIERIDTLGFRGEAIPSIASVSRFTLTTRRRDSDEGFSLHVNAGSLDATGPAGCPPGTIVEVKDLFCNVPARRKFLKSDATEESHVKHVFTVAALANADIGFSLAVDNRETLRLAPCDSLADRIRDIFGREFFDSLLEIKSSSPVKGVSVIGYIERPNQSAPTRRDQYIFVNGRAASAPSVAYALREAYPRKQGDVKPAAFIFINLPSSNVDVNVHPMKREVRFRDNAAVKTAIVNAITGAFAAPTPQIRPEMEQCVTAHKEDTSPIGLPKRDFGESQATVPRTASDIQSAGQSQSSFFDRTEDSTAKQEEEARPIQIEFAVAPDSTDASPWNWFKFLAVTGSGYLLIETDAGIVTIWPKAAQERIAYEKILDSSLSGRPAVIQPLLIPEMVRLSPADFSRIKACIDSVKASGFQLEEFGSDTFKIDGVPQLIGKIPPAGVIMTLAKDLSESGTKRGGMRWKEELIARSIAKSFAGSEIRLIEETAVKLIEELSSCRMPYVCPRGRPTMIFTSTRELSRRFGTE